jgi:hypothetical protein
LPRVFGRTGGDHDLLLWAGLTCCALGAALVWLAVRGPAPGGELASLWIAGVALLAGGVAAALLAWRWRKRWVWLDETSLARPWAAGKPSLPTRLLASLRESSSSELVVVSTDGAQLRIDTALPQFQQLLDLLCDRIADNGYPVSAAVWVDGPRAAAVTATEVTARWAGEQDETRVSWSEVTEVWLTRNSKRRLVPALRCQNGEGVKFPHLGKQKTLELYRALRQHVRHRPLPESALRERQRRERRQAARSRGVVLRVVALAALLGAAFGAQQSCQQPTSPRATPLSPAPPSQSVQ